MRTDPGVIDLGVIDLGTAPPGPDGASSPDEDPAWPAGTGTPGGPAAAAPAVAHSIRNRLRRSWPLAALTLLLVASTGAAAPASRGLVPAFQVPTDQRTSVALTPHTLYVATGTPASALVEDPVWTFSAYRLSDGALRWRVPHDPAARHSSVSVQVVDGIPLVTGWRTHSAQTVRPPIDYAAQTTAYHAESGETRWTHTGFAAGYTDGRVVLELLDYQGNPPDPVTYLTTTVDLETGRILWSHRLGLDEPPLLQPAGAGAWALSEDGRYLAMLRRDGRLSVLDLSTGAEAVEDLGRTWRDASLLAVDGLLRVSTIRDRKRVLAVYDLYPPAERWTTAELTAPTTLNPCGPVFCLRSPDRLQGVDMTTGTVRWTTEPEWSSASSLQAPWEDGQLQLVRRTEDDHTGRTAVEAMVVDAATGREVRALGAWQAYPVSHHHPYPVVSLREEGAHRPGHPDYDPGRLWLGRVEPDQPRVRVLGALDRATSCDLGERYLACVLTDRRVEVRHLR